MDEVHNQNCDMCLESEASIFRDDGLCEECGEIVDHGVQEEIANLDYAEYLHDGYSPTDDDF